MRKIEKDDYKKLDLYENRYVLTEDIPSELKYGNPEVVKKPFISFVIPTYNRPKELGETIDSILKQPDICEYEIIIVDNSANMGADNATYKFISQFNNPRILYYINKENIGMEGNWNRCITLARGKYVSMIHDDDLLCEDYMEEIIRCIKNAENLGGKIGVIKTSYVDYKEGTPVESIHNRHKGGLKRYHKLDCLIKGIGPTSCPTCGIIFSKKAALDVGGFDSTFYPSSDYVLGYQMIRKGYRAYVTEDKLGMYRIGINESIKKENIIGFCTSDCYFRNYMYRQSLFNYIYGLIFEKVEYSMSVRGQRDNGLKFRVDIPIEEFIIKKGYGEYKFMSRVYNKTRQILSRFTSKIYEYKGEN